MFAVFQRTVTLFLEILIFRFSPHFIFEIGKKNKEHPKLKNNLVYWFLYRVFQKKLGRRKSIYTPNIFA